MKVIELNNISLYYDKVCALHDINLAVEEKDFLGIIGPNGGGKTSLFKIILGLIPPSSGRITVFSQSPRKAAGRIGYVPQFLKFDRQFPIDVNDVVLAGRLRGNRLFRQRFSLEDKQIAAEVMKRLDIYELRYRQIGSLSGGQLQKVLIARAMVSQPDILLLDEPTASLDSHSKNQIYDILAELNQDMTILMVSHDMGVISSYVKNIACLNITLHYHGRPELTSAILGRTYGCPVELLAHGVPHRVLQHHLEEKM